MYNFSFSAVLPFTAAALDYDRLYNALVGMIIILLLLLVGFSAIQSDFKNIEPTNLDNHSFTLQANNQSVCTSGQKQNSPYSAGPVCGRGLLYPMMPSDQFLIYLMEKDCGTVNTVLYDSTIYLSTDLVDKPPELIWMIYPELSRAGLNNVSSVQVTLSVLVDFCGKPLEVTITDETLMDNSAKQIILESARTSVFNPARKDNQSVRCWVQLPLELEVDA